MDNPVDRASQGAHPLPRKASLSLAAALARTGRGARGYVANSASGAEAPAPGGTLPLIVQASTGLSHLIDRLGLGSAENISLLTDGFFSAKLYAPTVRKLLEVPEVRFVQRKSTYEPHLLDVLQAAGIRGSKDGRNRVVEDGTGVLIGIVDSGFDLSHPAFRMGGRLRVEGLLDQVDGREYDTDQLERLWAGTTPGPGFDASGHGTHVASIAAGSEHSGLEGAAPGARFLLVRTDFENTDVAVEWIFRKAAGRPCVVNLSFGGHDGAHDGTHPEEVLHTKLSGPGRIVVVAAGNDRQHPVHLGHSFHTGDRQELAFDIGGSREGRYPNIVLQAWHNPEDTFELVVYAPDGTQYPVPRQGEIGPFGWRTADIYVAGHVNQLNHYHSSRIEVYFRGPAEATDLVGWRLWMKCERAVFGRLDAWIMLANQGRFHHHAHTLVDATRTLCVPATGPSCIAVGSFVSRNRWTCETEPFERTDRLAVTGRISRFSALGPCRDGRWKPDIAAPGEHVTAAMAAGSSYAEYLNDRSRPSDRAVTISGTSMAAPVVAGIIAMMLQKKNGLTTDQAREILKNTARHDGHTGGALWTPAYGYGKVDARAALASL